MNIQIFGTTKCFDTKKAQRYFKERGIKFQMIAGSFWSACVWQPSAPMPA